MKRCVTAVVKTVAIGIYTYGHRTSGKRLSIRSDGVFGLTVGNKDIRIILHTGVDQYDKLRIDKEWLPIKPSEINHAEEKQPE